MKKLLLLVAMCIALGIAPHVHAQDAKPKQPNTTRTKKDGTPDKRFKENKKIKKDGTPDKRFKENKKK